MNESRTITGAWNEECNAWVSDELCLSGNAVLDVTLPQKGRLVIKQLEDNGRWPKALVTKWCGPCMRIRIFGATYSRYIKIFLTEEPQKIILTNI